MSITPLSPLEIGAALTTFIKSGSADGNEETRKECLRLIPAFMAAPAMIDLLRKLEQKELHMHYASEDAGAILKRIEG